ncbi:MAG: hypothetical protein AAF575_11705 [Bacteroidota bacterium]
MKRSYFLLMLVLIGFIKESRGQSAGGDSQLLRFYKNLAVRDATHEQTMNLGHQDELDYWIDQENYERQLGKLNFSFYLVYMKSKKEAHRNYLQQCKSNCEHTAIYWSKMRNYLSVPDSVDVFQKYAGKWAQSSKFKNK